MIGLAQRLQVSTKEIHAKAERTTLMAALIRGQIERPAYRTLLENLQAIYNALERELGRHRGHASLSPLMLEGLARSDAIAADLGHMADERAVPAALTRATSGYVDRLHLLGEQAPMLLVAHSYVRYLGDLYGGQMLSSVVAKRIGAPTSFYDFGSPDTVAELKNSYRQGLDGLPLTERDVDAIVVEATSAFERHVDLFSELAG